MGSRLAAVLTAALVVMATSACNDDGRALAPAPPTTAPVADPTIDTRDDGSPDDGVTIDPANPVDVGFALTSPAFVDAGFLDPQFTCDGLNVAPPLEISAAPLASVEIAIAVTDPDAADFVHWVVSGIPASITKLDASLLPAQAVVARTDSGTDGWDGPCPPVGDQVHAYVFTAYALAEPIGLAPGIDGAQAIALLEAATLDTATVTAFYQRVSDR